MTNERNEYAATMYLSRLMALSLKRGSCSEDYIADHYGPWHEMIWTTVSVDGQRYLRDQHGRIRKSIA